MLTTAPVAAMQILTLAVPLSEAYKSALEQFNKLAKKAEAPDYPLQRPLDYGSDKGNHKHIVFRNSILNFLLKELNDLKNTSPIDSSLDSIVHEFYCGTLTSTSIK